MDRSSLFKFFEFLEAIEQFEEARYVVRRVVVGFPKEVGNFTDAHSTLPVFGNAWGRGVLFQQGNEYIAVVAGGGSSHAQIKQRGGGMPIVKTFYISFRKKAWKSLVSRMNCDQLNQSILRCTTN